jgi:hypothetical protein
MDGREFSAMDFEVLAMPMEQQGQIVWRKVRGPLTEVPAGAVVAGSYRDGNEDKPTYVARVQHQGGLHSGFVCAGDSLGMSVGWGGLQIRIPGEYEVLVLLTEDERTLEEWSALCRCTPHGTHSVRGMMYYTFHDFPRPL